MLIIEKNICFYNKEGGFFNVDILGFLNYGLAGMYTCTAEGKFGIYTNHRHGNTDGKYATLQN